MTRPLERDAAMLAAERLKVFAQPQRLMILSALIDRELAVGAIEGATGIGQSALSQQLAELRRGGLVAQRRESKQILYRLADDRVLRIVTFIGAVFDREDDPQAVLDAVQRPATPIRVAPSAALFAIVDR